jgi:hypothetical protein
VPAAERVDTTGGREMLTVSVAQGHARHAETGEEHGSDATGRECDRRLTLKLPFLRGHASPLAERHPESLTRGEARGNATPSLLLLALLALLLALLLLRHRSLPVRK